MKLIISAVLALVAGVLIGSIPLVNEHLHWNFYLIVPVSGFFLGMVFGLLQYQVARLVHARISLLGGVILTVICAASYIATDVGVWASSSIKPDGRNKVPLRDTIQLKKFLAERVSHSSISRGSRSVELGDTATLVTFVVDLIGSMVGGAAILFGLSSDASYCQRCSRYRKDLRQIEREFPMDEAQAASHWQAFEQLAAGQHYAQLAAQVQALPGLNVASRRKLEAQESRCPKCGQTALQLSVLHYDKEGDWATEGRQLQAEAAHDEGALLVS